MKDKNIYIKKLSENDGLDIFEMLQQIQNGENAFTNPVEGMSYEQYKKWLKEQENISLGIDLKEGYVPQTIFWLMDGNKPVGLGKIRHKLTDNSRRKGGNIGLAISKEYRGCGYGSILLSELLCMMKQMEIEEYLYTVKKYNYASKKVAEKNGLKLIKENSEWWFYSI